MQLPDKNRSTNSMRNKKLQVWLPLLLSLCMVAGMFIGYRIKANMPNRSIFFMQPQRPVQEVLDLIKNNYVDSENIDSIGTVAIQSMLSALDPHSVFLPASTLKSINEDLQGIFYGIGVEFSIINDTTNVINVLPGSPSFKAGLQIGDQLIKVNDSLIAGNHIDGERLKNLLRGSDGSKVQITIRRKGVLKNVDVYRGPIPIYSLDAAYMVTDTTGYIRLNKFSENTYKEFMQSMDKLHAQGMRALILDLRDNGGGILTEATHIADEFLSGNKLITYTEGAHSPRKDYRCDKEGVFEKGTLIVLANEGTASASEILIGALQDWDRATIIGRRTFGKGLVQEQYVLGDGSGLRLTVARYYTPLGRSIQKPYDGNIRDYDNDILNRFKHGEMNSADSIKHTNEKKYTTPSGHIVFAGGGISPDIFVGVDTNSLNREVMKSVLNGSLNRFAYFNFMKNAQQFKKYSDVKSFGEFFHVTDSTLNEFKQLALSDSIHINLKDSIVKQQIEKQIKVLTARQIWSTEGFYEINNLYDQSVKKAIDYLKEIKK